MILSRNSSGKTSSIFTRNRSDSKDSLSNSNHNSIAYSQNSNSQYSLYSNGNNNSVSSCSSQSSGIHAIPNPNQKMSGSSAFSSASSPPSSATNTKTNIQSPVANISNSSNVKPSNSSSKLSGIGNEITSVMTSVSNRFTASFPSMKLSSTTNSRVNGNNANNSNGSSKSSYYQQQESEGNNINSRLASTYPIATNANHRAMDGKRLEIGLDNLGNTCFANSSLQCLLHILPLAKYFLESDIKNSINYSSPMKGDLASSFSELIKEAYKANSGTSVSPLKFLRAVSIYAPHLLDNNQQDCQEFLRFILDGMCEDLCRRNHKINPSNINNSVADTAMILSTENLAMSPSSLRRLQMQQQKHLFNNSNTIMIHQKTPTHIDTDVNHNISVMDSNEGIGTDLPLLLSPPPMKYGGKSPAHAMSTVDKLRNLTKSSNPMLTPLHPIISTPSQSLLPLSLSSSSSSVYHKNKLHYGGLNDSNGMGKDGIEEDKSNTEGDSSDIDGFHSSSPSYVGKQNNNNTFSTARPRPLRLSTLSPLNPNYSSLPGGDEASSHLNNNSNSSDNSNNNRHGSSDSGSNVSQNLRKVSDSMVLNNIGNSQESVMAGPISPKSPKSPKRDRSVNQRYRNRTIRSRRTRLAMTSSDRDESESNYSNSNSYEEPLSPLSPHSPSSRHRREKERNHSPQNNNRHSTNTNMNMNDNNGDNYTDRTVITVTSTGRNNRENRESYYFPSNSNNNNNSNSNSSSNINVNMSKPICSISPLPKQRTTTMTTSEYQSPSNPMTSDSTNISCNKVRIEADKAWDAYLKFNDSVISDVFAGQLQSTIECMQCHHKSYCFDPFLDLSVPIPKHTITEQKQSSSSSGFLGRRVVGGGNSNSNNNSHADPTNCTLEECLDKFLGEEVLEGDNMVTCDSCKTKQRCVKRMSIYRYPKILVIHIKRFRFYDNFHREKLLTDVNFPINGFDLSSYLSGDRLYLSSSSAAVAAAATTTTTTEEEEGGEENQQNISHMLSNLSIDSTKTNLNKNINSNIKYDLIGVSNHSGNMSGGHYIAHVDTNAGLSSSILEGPRWMCFNDNRVSSAHPSHIAGPTAYVLFYRLRGGYEELFEKESFTQTNTLSDDVSNNVTSMAGKGIVTPPYENRGSKEYNRSSNEKKSDDMDNRYYVGSMATEVKTTTATSSTSASHVSNSKKSLEIL